MIAKVLHGWRPAGLVEYLLGPGWHEEHSDPRLIWASDGAAWCHAPERTGQGPWDLDGRAVVAWLEQPAVEAGLPLKEPEPGSRYFGQQGFVLHCPVRLAPRDRTLSDSEWAFVAEYLMRAIGVGEDPDGCRAVAFRHAQDHIHLVATLVRVDTGKRFWPRFSKLKLRTACRELERRLGLTMTAKADRTALPDINRGEIERAKKRGTTVVARTELRRTVSAALAGATTVEEFFYRLRDTGTLVHIHRGPDNVVCGYAVALSADRDCRGRPVYYSGCQLGLSMGEIRRLLASAPGRHMTTQARRRSTARPSPAARRSVVERATATVIGARTALHEGRDSVHAISWAAYELLSAVGHAVEGPAATAVARNEISLVAAAGEYQRAARMPWTRVPEAWGPASKSLRVSAREITNLRVLPALAATGQAVSDLIAQLSALVTQIATVMERADRLHQALAARTAAARMTVFVRQRWPRREDHLTRYPRQNAHLILPSASERRQARGGATTESPRPPYRGTGRGRP